MSPTRLTAAAFVALAMGLGAAGTAAAQAAATAEATASATFKPVAVQGDLMDSLRLNGGFTTFVKASDATNLSGMFKTNKNLTIFAPTDAAFAAMPPAELTALMADKARLQKFVLHHVVNAPVPSTKIKGTKGPLPTPAGDNVLLDGSDEAGPLRVDGATIVQADVQTGSGLLQVVDKVLIAGQGNPDPAPEAAPAAPAT